MKYDLVTRQDTQVEPESEPSVAPAPHVLDHAALVEELSIARDELEMWRKKYMDLREAARGVAEGLL